MYQLCLLGASILSRFRKRFHPTRVSGKCFLSMLLECFIGSSSISLTQDQTEMSLCPLRISSVEALIERFLGTNRAFSLFLLFRIVQDGFIRLRIQKNPRSFQTKGLLIHQCSLSCKSSRELQRVVERFRDLQIVVQSCRQL